MNLLPFVVVLLIVGYADGMIERMTIARHINPKMPSTFWVRQVRDAALVVAFWYAALGQR